LDNNGNPVANTTTNGSGIYNFNNLKPGIEYVVVFTKPAGYNTTGANIGIDGSDSDASIINGKASPVILSSGENNPTIDAGYYLPASLGDFVWEDKNANGIQDTGETGIANVIVTLVGTDGAGNPVSLTTATNNLGAYNFTNLAPGSYTVTFNKPLNFVASPTDLGGDDAKDSDANPTTGIATTVTLASGDNNSTIDAGFFKPASLGDYVWEDKNANGQQDPSEPVIANVVVSLEDASGNQATDINGNLVPSTTTNTSGIYSFTNLKPGVEYVVKFTTPSGFVPTQTNLGVDISDSDADRITGKTLPVILASGENNPTIDAGYYLPASLGDFVWDDKNGNGVQDSGEPGISGAVVNLTGTDGAGNPVSLTTTTNASGLYEFTNLAPGSYTVTFEKPAGFTSGSPVDLGGNDLKDSDANPTTGVSPSVTLVSGENNTTIDAGFYKPASLGDYVWLDTNGNGVQDSGEIGIPNVTVSLTGITSLGSPVSLSMITGSNGEYAFTNLLPGNYTVTFTKPTGYIYCNR
jgi:SdrD B-like domain